MTYSGNRRRAAYATGVLLLGLTVQAQEKPAINYDDHIKPIFRQHCLKCHGDDEQKSDLNLQSFQTVLKGGSGGMAVVAGRANASLLYQAITEEDADARMPPNQPPLPEEQIKLVMAWINNGLRESKNSQSMVSKRDLTFKPLTSANVGDAQVIMPENWATIALADRIRSAPVVSMDSSPRAPIVAVAGWEHVKLFHTETKAELGILPFPEGTPQVIRFSHNGAVLMVAGGKPVQSGRVILFDVRSGQRVAEIGDEVDAVMAADLSPSQQLVALGGSGKVVKVYDTASGELKFKLERHTDWITNLAFSPNGKKIATADRAGGLHIWDASNGGILLTLAEHKSAIPSLHWRSDSRVLVSAGEDGQLIWWDTVDGWPAITRNNAHPPNRPEGYYGSLRNGILSAAFGPNGELLTAGRDHVVRYWNSDGNVTKTINGFDAIPLSTRISHDGSTLVIGDAAGTTHFEKP